MNPDRIPFDDIPPHCLLIVRAPEAAQEEIVTLLRAKVDPSVAILPAHWETELLCITEPVLNAAGWYRRAFTT